jgi:DNA-binding IclR family transcriptional regulator
MAKKQEGGVAAVDRALAILGAFRDGDVSLTLHELAQRTDLYKSTILRLISTLEKRGCILRLEDGSYQLGPTLVRWASLCLTSVRVETHVTPVLERLSAETGESATFYTRHGDARMCLARVDCTRSVRDHVRVGDILPLQRGAGGRVLVAFDPASKKVRPPSMVIVTMRERDAEGAGMAAPVFGPGDSLRGAISLSGPATRFNDAAFPKLAKPLVAAAADLTTRLGGDPSGLNSALASPANGRKLFVTAS